MRSGLREDRRYLRWRFLANISNTPRRRDKLQPLNYSHWIQPFLFSFTSMTKKSDFLTVELTFNYFGERETIWRISPFAPNTWRKALETRRKQRTQIHKIKTIWKKCDKRKFGHVSRHLCYVFWMSNKTVNIYRFKQQKKWKWNKTQKKTNKKVK